MNNRSEVEFYEFTEKIKENDFEWIKAALKESPDWVLFRNEEHESLLSVALQWGNHTMLNTLLATLSSQFPHKNKEMLNLPTSNGWTPLHYAARYADFTMYSSIVNALGNDINKAVKQVAYQKLKESETQLWLPIELVTQNPHRSSLKIKHHLENLTIDSPESIKPIHAPIDINTIIQDYHVYDEQLIENLKYACIAARYARRILQDSITHPYFNQIPNRRANELNIICDDARQDYQNQNSVIDDIITEYNNDFMTLNKLDNIRESIDGVKIGACSSYSYLVLHALINMGINLPAEMYCLTNGDHQFVVVGKDPQNSKEDDYTTWGPHAVVIDAWSGEVYPAYALPEKMKDHKSYKKKENNHVNLVFPFNEKFHQLASIDEFKLSDEFFIKQRKPDYKWFEEDEEREIRGIKRKRLESEANYTEGRFFESFKKHQLTQTSSTNSPPVFRRDNDKNTNSNNQRH